MSSTDRPRFSVVIPAYNEANYIGATLASLARQDFPGAVEVIVVDNNCTDDTAEI
ncbi:Glycosyl transferase, family 2 domain protein, partial [mine drainage metagenome]